MTIYITMFISCFLCCFISSKIKNKKFSFIFDVIAILIPSIIAGNRSLSIGTDISVYGEYMHYVASHSSPSFFFSVFGYSDILFSIFTLIIGSVFKDVHVFLFFIQFINCILIHKACKNYEDNVPVCISYLLFLTALYFRQLNLLRQGVALSFSILAVSYLLKDNKKKFFIFLFCASLFHISAVFVISIYFLYKYSKKKYEKKLAFFTTYIVLLLILILFLPILKVITSLGILPSKYTYEYFTHFLNANHEIDNLGTFFKLFWCVVTFCTATRKGVKNKIKNFQLLFHFVFIDFILWNYNIYIYYVDRISFYFGYVYVLFLLPQYVKIFKNDLISKIFYYTILVSLFLAYWYVRFIIQNAGSVYPYVHY